jgi:hypothetical protein
MLTGLKSSGVRALISSTRISGVQARAMEAPKRVKRVWKATIFKMWMGLYRGNMIG